MKSKINYSAIAVFYIIAIACRYIAVKTNVLNAVDNIYLSILLRGVGPAIGAFAAIKIFNLTVPLSLKGIYKTIFIPFAVYWILPAVLIATVYYFVLEKFPLLFMFTVLLYGLLEEIGWRGFLQEQLKEIRPLFATLIIAVLWFVWHLNFELTSGNLLFFGIIFFGSWGIGKIYSKTGSLLAVAGVHSLNNFFVEGVHQKELIIIGVLLTIWIGFVMVYDKRSKAKMAIQS